MSNKLAKWLLLLALTTPGIYAQSTVTATITDSDSTAWSSLNGYNAPYTITLVSSTGTAVPAGQAFVSATGATVTTSFTGNLSSSGALSVSLYNNSAITPANTQWQFHFCPATSSPVCTTTSLTISTSGSISTQLSAATVAPRLGGGQGSFAYADVEVAGVTNNTYYNITTPACRYYGSSWGACGAGTGATLPFPGLVYATSAAGGTTATSSQVQTALGAGVYDAYGLAQPNPNIFYISTNCSGQTHCFTAKADVQWVNDASWSNTGTSITTGSGDPAFACPGGTYPCSSGGDVGKIEYGTSNCSSTNGYINCLLEVPQGTITSITSAHVAVVSVAATNSSAGNASWFAWGTQDDSSAMTAAMTAVLAAGGGEIDLPCGSMFIQNAPFIVSSPHKQPITIRGCANTYLMPTPNFSQATCLAYGASTTNTGCIFSDWETTATSIGVAEQSPYVYDHLYDFHVWGLGQDGTSLTARYTAISGQNIYAQNVEIIGWLSAMTAASPTSCAWDISSSMLINSYGWSATYCGVAVEGDSVTANPTQIINGFYGIPGVGMYINGFGTGNGTHIMSYAAQFACSGASGGCTPSATLNGVVITGRGAIWRSYGDEMSGVSMEPNGSNENATYAYLEGARPFLNAGLTLYSSIPSGVVWAHNSVISTLNVGAAYYYDEGGNTVSTVTAVPTHVFGSSSVTGTAAAASNITASTGWGTSGAAGNGISNVSGTSRRAQFEVTAAGTPTSNPTITYTFPTGTLSPWYYAPLCTMTQVAGTGASLTPVIVGTISTTSALFTVTGTPAAASTYYFQISCSYND
jgi:hypothetical protein